jgi:muconate cycloisomerase
MKIVRVETITVKVPVHSGAWHSPEFEPEGYEYGGQWVRLHWQEWPIALLLVHTDDGQVGLGELAKSSPAEAVAAVADRFVGREVLSFNLLNLPFDSMWTKYDPVQTAYDMALYDLTGKALGLPVYKLLGGKYRDWVPVSRCSGRMNPEHAAETAKQAVAQGYSVLKMKATAYDPLVERLGAIQDAVGDKLNVVVDPNQRFLQPYKLFEIDDAIRAAGIKNLQCYESPFDHDNLDWYVLARQKLHTPIALHIQDPRAITEAIKREATDWLNIGGVTLSNTFKTAALAEAAGIPTWHGSGVGVGVSEAAYTHVSAACRSMTLTSDICGETLRVNDLIKDPLVIENGHVRVPEGPGLGVELDWDAVDNYRVA